MTDAARGTATTTYRDHLFSMVILSVLAFGALVSLAVLAPLPFQTQADPYSTPSGMRPPWYMLAPYALIERGVGPRWLLGAGLSVASLLVLLVPLWVRSADDARGRRRVRLWGGLALAVWIALSVLGLFLDRPS